MTTRRDFIRTSAGVGAGAALGAFPKTLEGAPNVVIRRVTPTCVASANGLGAVSRAIQELADGATTIEAVVAGTTSVTASSTHMTGIAHRARSTATSSMRTAISLP